MCRRSRCPWRGTIASRMTRKATVRSVHHLSRHPTNPGERWPATNRHPLADCGVRTVRFPSASYVNTSGVRARKLPPNKDAKMSAFVSSGQTARFVIVSHSGAVALSVASSPRKYSPWREVGAHSPPSAHNVMVALAWAVPSTLTCPGTLRWTYWLRLFTL